MKLAPGGKLERGRISYTNRNTCSSNSKKGRLNVGGTSTRLKLLRRKRSDYLSNGRGSKIEAMED